SSALTTFAPYIFSTSLSLKKYITKLNALPNTSAIRSPCWPPSRLPRPRKRAMRPASRASVLTWYIRYPPRERASLRPPGVPGDRRRSRSEILLPAGPCPLRDSLDDPAPARGGAASYSPSGGNIVGTAGRRDGGRQDGGRQDGRTAGRQDGRI